MTRERKADPEKERAETLRYALYPDGDPRNERILRARARRKDAKPPEDFFKWNKPRQRKRRWLRLTGGQQ